MTLLYKLALILFLEPTNNQEYIIKYYPIAYLCEWKYGVPVSVQLAQAIQESGGGRSNIAQNSNNHFGIKYYKNAYNGHYFIDRKGIKWRAYDSVYESYIDHAKFLNKHYRRACFKDYSHWSKLNGYAEKGYWKHICKIAKNKKLYLLDNHKQQN
jgi:flagellum-specific peptidoglycan hydrolase FlgJ